MEQLNKNKNEEWTENQKIAFVLIQDVCAKMGLNNGEVAQMFTTFSKKEEVFTHFQFVTTHWLNEDIFLPGLSFWVYYLPCQALTISCRMIAPSIEILNQIFC